MSLLKTDTPWSAHKSRMSRTLFSEGTKMADMLLANGRLLYVLPCFGIEMGLGEKTAEEICAQYGVSLPLFLVVCNMHTFDDYAPDNALLREIDVMEVVKYLKSSHKSYLEIDIPEMEKNLLALAEHHIHPASRNMLIAFCDKYRQDVVAHIKYEEEVVFPYVCRLSDGERPEMKLSDYQNIHSNVDTTLRDLRSVVIKYVPSTCPVRHCLSLIGEIFIFEDNLHRHTRLEEMMLMPLIEMMQHQEQSESCNGELSDRERQTLAALARGLSNKEIAHALCISRHTVVSHRKNIVRKTGLKTAQGLTLYAFINKLITLKELR